MSNLESTLVAIYFFGMWIIGAIFFGALFQSVGAGILLGAIGAFFTHSCTNYEEMFRPRKSKNRW